MYGAGDEPRWGHLLPDAPMNEGTKYKGYGRVLYVWDPGGALLHSAQFN